MYKVIHFTFSLKTAHWHCTAHAWKYSKTLAGTGVSEFICVCECACIIYYNIIAHFTSSPGLQLSFLTATMLWGLLLYMNDGIYSLKWIPYDRLRSFLWQFYLLSQFLSEIYLEEPTKRNPFNCFFRCDKLDHNYNMPPLYMVVHGVINIKNVTSKT